MEKVCSKMLDVFGVAGISKLDEETYQDLKKKYAADIEKEGYNPNDKLSDIVEGIAISRGEIGDIEEELIISCMIDDDNVCVGEYASSQYEGE